MPITGNWTYSGSPGDSPRDAVRFLIHDTDPADPKLSDEEIEWLLDSTNANIYRASIVAATQVATTFSSLATTKTVGALSISYASRASDYRLLATDLLARLRSGWGLTFIPYAGGISVSDKRTNEQDTDWDKPAFARRMHDNPALPRPELSPVYYST